MHSLLPIIVVAVALATVLNVALKRIAIPTVIGYIFTGAVIGPLFDIHVHDNENLEHVAEFGVVFLMFTIGLEFSPPHLKRMLKEVLAYGASQVLLSALLLATAASLLLDLELEAAIVVGAGLALSSTAIVLKLLNESGKMNTEYGRNALGILIFQDIAVIPILLMISLFTSKDKALGDVLMETGTNAVIVLGLLILFGRYALNYIFMKVSDSNSKEIFMGLIFFVVIGASWVAHHFGFSYSLGAFIAGMMIADTIHKYQVEADLIPFRDLLLGVFFITVGLQIDPTVVVHNIGPLLGYGAAIVALKGACIFVIVRISSTSETALRTAISLSQVGEFALVVFSLVLAHNMIDPTLGQVLMAVVVMSMIATPVMINSSDRTIRLILRGTSAEQSFSPESVMGDHVLVCGYGAFGRAVSARLEDANINHVVIATDTSEYAKARKDNRQTTYGDPSDRVLLTSLNIKDAIATVVAMDDFEKTKLVTTSISHIDPDLKVIAKVPSEDERSELADSDHQLVLDGNSHIADLLVTQIMRSQLIAQEQSRLQFLQDVSHDEPARSINLVAKEQARLLDIMSTFFNGLREHQDMMTIKAYHESFKVLSEIIRKTLDDLTAHATLAQPEYERIRIILDSQHLLETMNSQLEELAYVLRDLEVGDKTRHFAGVVVEGLDVILLLLLEIAKEQDESELTLLDTMISRQGGLSRIRDTYLGEGRQLSADEKARMLTATNHIDRLRDLFGSLGRNYRQLIANA